MNNKSENTNITKWSLRLSAPEEKKAMLLLAINIGLDRIGMELVRDNKRLNTYYFEKIDTNK